MVELVSPGNKSNRRDFVRFVDKAVTVLEDGIHLLVVDPFPPTARDPAGLHAAIWRAAVRGRYAPPADAPLTAVSYVGGEEITAYVQPFAVGRPVPAMPLFLDPDEYVTVPLEATYHAAWAEVPPHLRAELEG
jgi:hypothetical protein